MTPEIEEQVQQALAATLHDYLVTRQTLSSDFMQILARQIAVEMLPLVEDMVRHVFREMQYMQYMQQREYEEQKARERYAAKVHAMKTMSPKGWPNL